MARDGDLDGPGGGGTSAGADDHDRLRAELAALAAEIARLRRDAREDRAALQHTERAFAAKTGELAAVYASRTWKAASLLRAAMSFGRRMVDSPQPAPAAPPPAPAPLVVAPAGATGELTDDAPAVSLVVLAAEPAALEALVALLARTPAGATFEVLLPLQAGAAAPAVPGVRSIPLPQPGTLAAACNAAAALAQGGHIAIWQAGTLPQPGWLGALADAQSVTGGMAGGVLLAPDGTLVAAGAEIAADGRLLPLLAGERPQHPAAASVEPVDATPLGCAMLPAAVWHRFGGLDAEIGSLDHAVAELGLRLRGAGVRVLRQPFARLVGRMLPPPDAWAEAHGRFRLRRLRLAHGHGLDSLGLPPAPAPRALFFDHFVPTPDRDSGSGDVAWSLRIFVALGWQVTLLPVNDLARADRYVDDLRRDGVRVVAKGWAASFGEALAHEQQPFDLIMVYRGTLVAKPMLDLLMAHSPHAKLVFNTVDLHFLRMEREALLTRSATLLEEAYRMQQTELAAMTRADCTILLSLAERRMIADLLPHARTCVIPIMRDIRGRRAPFAPRQGVVFVGSFQHRPNVDAVLSFVREVWPLVRARLDTTLTVVGADAPPEVAALADPAQGIAIAGHVADLDGVLDGCRLTVAPLRYGAGIKGKVVSSLAVGVPVVATPLAVEGMGLVDGAQVRVADTPQAFAEAVLAVHEQPALWLELSDGGLRFARESFSVAEARRRIAAMLSDLGLPAGEPEAA